ncbi:hypothetical protein [Staphylococcus phage phiSa2wa-st2974]|nr:hypothetical protein [Staphylococcus phage phiSa2wa-st923]UXR29047.1 hypothetical protein [Staphylococcus phage phiSa2wa-st1633]UYE96113.1 hypothetical protein [Staphylococcus phage phiSa2wa-st1232]UYE96182.1 hypothetical protein [Staphylococcus phage phiSa2wa-st2974]WAX25847.1 hypothetical protein [Staphylococcus phage phiSa2wa-st80.2]WAX25915.1 hypothetical protein [Staphylococcus phage phiSa2wa-st80.4]
MFGNERVFFEIIVKKHICRYFKLGKSFNKYLILLKVKKV